MASKIYCSNCGRLIPENSNFCRYCGAAQHGPEALVYRAEAPTVNNSPAAFVLTQAQKPPKSKKHEKFHEGHRVLKNQKLAKTAPLVFFLTYVVKTIIIVLLLAVGLVLDSIIFGIILAGYLALLYIIALAVYDSFRFTIDEDGFHKTYGIIHKQDVTIPYAQVENVNITRSFIDMIFGLARINIETAGSATMTPRNIIGGSKSNAEAHLPGVTLKQAKKIHDVLIDMCARSREA